MEQAYKNCQSFGMPLKNHPMVAEQMQMVASAKYIAYIAMKMARLSNLIRQ
jgi:hypothetical protein